MPHDLAWHSALLTKVPDLDDDTMHDLLEHVHDPVNSNSCYEMF